MALLNSTAAGSLLALSKGRMAMIGLSGADVPVHLLSCSIRLGSRTKTAITAAARRTSSLPLEDSGVRVAVIVTGGPGEGVEIDRSFGVSAGGSGMVTRPAEFGTLSLLIF